LRTMTCDRTRSTRMSTRPCLGENFTAFVRRFQNTCCSRSGSPWTGPVVASHLSESRGPSPPRPVEPSRVPWRRSPQHRPTACSVAAGRQECWTNPEDLRSTGPAGWRQWYSRKERCGGSPFARRSSRSRMDGLHLRSVCITQRPLILVPGLRGHAFCRLDEAVVPHMR
jgi:hypothetical protein